MKSIELHPMPGDNVVIIRTERTTVVVLHSQSGGESRRDRSMRAAIKTLNESLGAEAAYKPTRKKR